MKEAKLVKCWECRAVTENEKKCECKDNISVYYSRDQLELDEAVVKFGDQPKNSS